ncbi:MAG: hypothetical protein AB1813_07050 [Verrucomicrobiota bacterium]
METALRFSSVPRTTKEEALRTKVTWRFILGRACRAVLAVIRSKENFMRSFFNMTVGLCALILFATAIPCLAQDEDATVEISKVLRRYYEAMAMRDVEGLGRVLDAMFIVVEAGREQAKVHVINAAETAKLLPPEGNNDWQNLQVTDVKVSLSSTHPTVATVSFSVFHPLSPNKLKALQDVLKTPASPLNESQRREISKRLANGGRKESECAMLALRGGRWRIVSISVPK